MPSSPCFLLLLLALGSPSLWALDGTYTITTVPGNGLNVGLNTYRPGGYDDPAHVTKQYPLWVFLGGAGETGDPTKESVVLDKTTRHGPSKEIRFNGRDYPCIVVTPCTKNLQAARPDWLNDMVEMLKATERVDPNRVYFSGLCTGAGGVMEYAQLYPSQLAGIFPIITQSEFWNPGRLAKVPTWMFHAYDDPTVLRRETIAWANAIANVQSPAPLDCMANYPYGFTESGDPVRNALDQTGTFRPATGWDWVPGVTPTFDTLLRFTLYGSALHNSWQPTINNATVLRWAFRQHRKTAFAITPSPLPGRIEAEDFDRGGPNLAYKDHTASNSGGSAYRQVANTFDGTLDDEAVDLMDLDGGVAVTETEAGEWLEFTVNAGAGTYDLTLHVAAAAVGSSLRFTANGVPLTPSISVPATAGYTTLTVGNVTLAAGVHTLRLEVESGGSSIDWFAIAVPTAPTISDIPDQTIFMNDNTGALAFTIGDAQTAAESLAVSGSSSNTSLVPDENILFAGSGANRTVTVTPAVNQSGTATITVTVSDGSLSANASFILTVTAVNVAPVVSAGPDRNVVLPDTASLQGTVTDDGLPSGAVVMQTWSTVSGHGTVTIADPAAVHTTASFSIPGTYVLRLTASDGTLSAFDEMTVTVHAAGTTGPGDGGGGDDGDVGGSSSSCGFGNALALLGMLCLCLHRGLPWSPRGRTTSGQEMATPRTKTKQP